MVTRESPKKDPPPPPLNLRSIGFPLPWNFGGFLRTFLLFTLVISGSALQAAQFNPLTLAVTIGINNVWYSKANVVSAQEIRRPTHCDEVCQTLYPLIYIQMDSGTHCIVTHETNDDPVVTPKLLQDPKSPLVAFIGSINASEAQLRRLESDFKTEILSIDENLDFKPGLYQCMMYSADESSQELDAQ